MIGLGIDQKTNDLHFDATGNLALVQGRQAVAEHAAQRVRTFEGEWFLDSEAGLPWFQQLLGRRFDPALAEALVKAEIAETKGVIEITAFSVSFDQSSRFVNMKQIDFTTEYDEVT